ncbi:hypothetical protein P7K49_018417 [Saguinus oedipus]|uniref:Uncharacterized protein n=1 Tax=Saguinus oedipus TaxID=9490 RepID=A0ABQ9V5C0_SAGOE|nr:hypothetical protein P7K49_018417 [Saguinus oedipus]
MFGYKREEKEMAQLTSKLQALALNLQCRNIEQEVAAPTGSRIPVEASVLSYLDRGINAAQHLLGMAATSEAKMTAKPNKLEVSNGCKRYLADVAF